MTTVLPAENCGQGIVAAQPQRTADMTPTVSNPDLLVRRRPRSVHQTHFLRQRELDGATTAPAALRAWIESETLRKLDTGTYVDLGISSHLVRSTISIAFSRDGKFFASTHGDHTVKVFEYPSRKQIACLYGHPHTPWSVRFHPHDSSIIASGCRGGECRVWNIREQKCIRKHTFRSRISCVAFSASGELLAVSCGRQLYLWNYAQPTLDGSNVTRTPADARPDPTAVSPFSVAPFVTEPGMPIPVLGGNRAFHMVDFHPSGRMIMIGQSNRTMTANGRDPNDAQAAEEQFTLKLVIHPFDRRTGVNLSTPVLTIPDVVAYNDAGVHFSPCGTMLAACVPVVKKSQDFQIAVFSLTNGPDRRIGSMLYTAPLDKGHVTALTNLKFSSTGEHLLAGFSFPRGNPVLRTHAEHFDNFASLSFGEVGVVIPRLAPCGAPLHPEHPQVRVVDVYRVCKSFPRIRSLDADIDINEHNGGGAEDEINVAVFAPAHGMSDGILYGTQKGRIRMFQLATGRKSYPSGVCDDNCKLDRLPPARPVFHMRPEPPLPAPAAPNVDANALWNSSFRAGVAPLSSPVVAQFVPRALQFFRAAAPPPALPPVEGAENQPLVPPSGWHRGEPQGTAPAGPSSAAPAPVPTPAPPALPHINVERIEPEESNQRGENGV